jgi:hypothetical protein
MATVPTILSEPILVANLPLPPEEAESLERWFRSRRLKRSEREFIEDDVKLDYHYSGHYIIATIGPPGPARLQIHAIDLQDPDEGYELRKRLRALGYRHILSLYPRHWKDSGDHSMILL